MARYRIGFTKTTTTAAGLLAQLRAGASRDLEIVEIGLFASTAVSGTVGLIRPSAVGATFTSTAVGSADDPISGASAAVVDTAATTPPTIGTNYMHRITLPATIGAGVIWTFDTPLLISVSASMALWQISTAAVTYDGYIVYNE